MERIMILALLAIVLQDSRPPEFTKFDVTRERVGHKVVVEAALRNAAPAEISGLKLTAIYYDLDRELKRSAPVAIPKIAPGAAAAFKIETEQLPNFSRYEIYLETPAATIVYVGTDTTKLPSLRPATGARLVLASHAVSPLTLVLRNPGQTAADEPTAALAFKDASGAVVHRARLRLEKLVGPATEDTFELSIPGVPPHASVDVSLAWQASDEIVLADPQGAPRDLFLRQGRAVRLSDGSARVSGTFANGSAGTVQKISARFQLGRHDAPYELPGALKAGDSRAFVFYVPSCPAFDTLGFALSFEGGGAVAGEAPQPSSRRTASRRVEAERVSLPPPPKAVKEAAFAASRPPSVGVRGLLVVEGVFGKNNKYTGDTYLMRLIFLDEKGKPYQPEATVTFNLYDGEKHLKKAQRTVTRAGWGAESTRVNLQTVDLDTIACDRKTGELWVAIHWSDAPWKKPRADLVVEIKDGGTYTLKGVEKDWAFAPAWPDGK